MSFFKEDFVMQTQTGYIEPKSQDKVDKKQTKKPGNYNFSHPKIYGEFSSLLKIYYSKHTHLPKAFRVTFGEYIMRECAECMKIIIMANIKKSTEDFISSNALLKDLRARIEVIRGYFLISWEMKFISHGFFAILNEKVESISKQAAAWHEWFLKEGKK